METKQTFGVQFTTRKSKCSDNEKSLTIFARVTVNGARSEISLKQNVAHEDWSASNGIVQGKRKEARDLNQFLEQVRTKLNNIYRELIVEGDLPTATIIKNHFLGIHEQGKTLLDTFAYHQKISKSELSGNTLKHYITTERYVKEFLNRHFRTTDIYLSKLNYKFVTDFEYFLRNREPVNHIKPMQNNGVMKHIERLRKVVRLAKTPCEKGKLV